MALNKAAPAQARRTTVRAQNTKTKSKASSKTSSKTGAAKKKPAATPVAKAPAAARRKPVATVQAISAADGGIHSAPASPTPLTAPAEDQLDTRTTPPPLTPCEVQAHGETERELAIESAVSAPKPERAPKSKTKRKPSKRAQPKGLVQRVYNTIDGELSKLEAQKGASSQDRERASRALSQMVSSLEKAVEMQREIAKDAKKGGNAKDQEALRHAEDLRQQIADRIEQLQLERASAKRSSDAE